MSLLVPKQLPGVPQLLAFLRAADMNVTTDQLMTFVNGMDANTDYLVTDVQADNASISLTLADGGIYTQAAKAGNPIVPAAQVYTALTGANVATKLALAQVRQRGQPILSLTGAQGAAATCDFHIFGIIIPPGA